MVTAVILIPLNGAISEIRERRRERLLPALPPDFVLREDQRASASVSRNRCPERAIGHWRG